jgi:metal-responsive CopG/Arc/MetJ family transcriptional regulator
MNVKRKRITKKIGRPPTGKALPVMALRLPTDLVERLDKWAADQQMTRSAAIRAMIEMVLRQSK